HDLELRIDGDDLPLEARSRVDCAARLLLQDERAIALLEGPQDLLVVGQLIRRSGELVGYESAFAARDSNAELGHQPLEVLHVEVRDLRSELRARVLDADRDHALLGHEYVREPLEVLERLVKVPVLIAFLETEAADDLLSHGPALQQADEHV